MCRKDLFLFLQDVCDFLLECKVLFAYVCIFKSGFHYVYILLYLLFVDLIHFMTHFLLDNLLYLLVILFLRVHPVAFNSTFFLHAFINQWQIWLLFCWIRPVVFHFFFLFLFLYLLFLLLTHWRVVGYGWGRRQSFFVRNWAFILHDWFLLFIFFYVFQRFDLLYVFFGKLVLHIYIFASLLVHLIENFVHLWIIFETICVSESV